METPIFCYHCGEEAGYTREYVATIPWQIELFCCWCGGKLFPGQGISIQSHCSVNDYWLHKASKGFLPPWP